MASIVLILNGNLIGMSIIWKLSIGTNDVVAGNDLFDSLGNFLGNSIPTVCPYVASFRKNKSLIRYLSGVITWHMCCCQHFHGPLHNLWLWCLILKIMSWQQYKNKHLEEIVKSRCVLPRFNWWLWGTTIYEISVYIHQNLKNVYRILWCKSKAKFKLFN